MNALVQIALRRPLTFVVLALLILLFGGRAVLDTPTDVFPNIGIPVVAAVWTYNGLTPEDMSGRVVYYYERALTAVVSNIEHVESQSVYGFGVVKVFFHPGTDINAAQAQIAAVSQTVLKQMPAGITPPLILVYNASSVPVMNLQVSGANVPVQRLQDLRAPSKWTSIRRNCSPTASLPRTCSRPSTNRTSSCRPATRRSATSTTS